MGREIKFRVWDEAERRMMSWEEVDEHDKMGVYQFLDIIEEDGFEVMQYTGLKDKNGREIYEGDFIRDRESFDEIYHYTVIWSESNACFYFKDWFGTEHFGGEDIELTRAEVIGNIYENPELLEV